MSSRFLLTPLALAIAVLGLPAFAAPVHIPAGPLSGALAQYAQQQGIHLSLDAKLTQGKMSRGLQGDVTVPEGLRTLLNGTDLEFWQATDGTYSVRNAEIPFLPMVEVIAIKPLAVVASSGEVTLPAVEVEAAPTIETATSPVKGYVAKRSATATKTDTPLIETAQSISVVTRDQMDVQDVQTVSEALRYTSGVLTEFTGYDLRFESIKIRGFDADKYRDGLRVFSAATYGDTVFDPQGLERAEVLKGPSSVMYGQGSPGGKVNLVSKRPAADLTQEVALTIGNHDLYEASFDAGGAITEDQSWLFRINGLARDSKTQTDFSQDNRLFIAPALTWKPSNKTTLTLLADITRDRVTPKSWFPNKFLITENINGSVPVERFVGEPGFDHYDRDSKSISYLFTHNFDNWTLQQNARYGSFDLNYQHIYAYSFNKKDQKTLERGSLRSIEDGKYFVIDTNAQTKVTTGAITHTLIAGLDYQTSRSTGDEGYGDASSLDVFNPVYGGETPELTTERTNNKLKQIGFYAQDQMHISNWIVNLGLRHDKADTKSESETNKQDANDSATTYNASALYHFDSGFAPYASYATSFSPILGSSFDGQAFKPETAKQYEIGLKYQPAQINALFTASLFDLRKQNVTTDDLDNPGNQIQTGEIQSRGFEFEAKAGISKQLDLLASYTYLDSKITKTNDPTELGKQQTQAARNTANIWLDYRFSGDALAGWAVGSGARYVGKVPGDTANTYYNDGYTLVDLALRYQLKDFNFSLNVDNLFDKITTANRGQFFGEARKVTGKIAYRW